ncbi:single-stranded DNA-binding protein (plasmid) [Dyella sp. BiH032]|uniref:single-stranded DNA-binding protein n=1 Tax=Dyella sp. BiH032 TaxID=3075430 RepID=UPI0028934A45|nr:single-stranded DNA-binding protein [Dyella sp. BiH032]WNL48544.1 single-stranded DNA-binding protein [Dyella sp. BiH032]
MASLNRVTLIGNAGQAPKLRHTNSGKAACQLDLATNERWKDRQTGELKSHAEWHRVQLYGRHAEVAVEFVKTGREILITGKNRTRKYTDKNGVERYVTEVIAHEFQLIGTGSQAASAPHGRYDDDVPPPSGFEDDDDDLPL